MKIAKTKNKRITRAKAQSKDPRQNSKSDESSLGLKSYAKTPPKATCSVYAMTPHTENSYCTLAGGLACPEAIDNVQAQHPPGVCDLVDEKNTGLMPSTSTIYYNKQQLDFQLNETFTKTKKQDSHTTAGHTQNFINSPKLRKAAIFAILEGPPPTTTTTTTRSTVVVTTTTGKLLQLAFLLVIIAQILLYPSIPLPPPQQQQWNNPTTTSTTAKLANMFSPKKFSPMKSKSRFTDSPYAKKKFSPAAMSYMGKAESKTEPEVAVTPYAKLAELERQNIADQFNTTPFEASFVDIIGKVMQKYPNELALAQEGRETIAIDENAISTFLTSINTQIIPDGGNSIDHFEACKQSKQMSILSNILHTGVKLPTLDPYDSDFDEKYDNLDNIRDELRKNTNSVHNNATALPLSSLNPYPQSRKWNRNPRRKPGVPTKHWWTNCSPTPLNGTQRMTRWMPRPEDRNTSSKGGTPTTNTVQTTAENSPGNRKTKEKVGNMPPSEEAKTQIIIMLLTRLILKGAEIIQKKHTVKKRKRKKKRSAILLRLLLFYLTLHHGHQSHLNFPPQPGPKQESTHIEYASHTEQEHIWKRIYTWKAWQQLKQQSHKTGTTILEHAWTIIKDTVTALILTTVAPSKITAVAIFSTRHVLKQAKPQKFPTKRRKIIFILLILTTLVLTTNGSPTASTSTTEEHKTNVLTATAATIAAYATQTGNSNIDLEAERPAIIQHTKRYRGDQPTRQSSPNRINIHTTNIGGNMTEQWSTVVETASTGIQDAIIITETGDKNSKNNLQWYTREYISNEKQSAHEHFKKLPYTIYSVNSKDISGDRGGLVLLLHNRWTHRVRGKATYDPYNRWISIDVSTPDEKLTIIACYMRPNPQSNRPQAKLEWDSLKDHILRKHSKGYTILVAGDLNTTLDHPGHSTRKCNDHQNKLISNLIRDTNLIHTYIQRHGNAEYYTRKNKSDGSYTSPDHILFSKHAADRIKNAGVDEKPIREQNRDHASVHASIATRAPLHDVTPTQSSKIHFDTKRKDEYAKEIQAVLDNTPTPTDDIEKGKVLFNQCKIIASKLFIRKSHQTPKSTLVAKLKNDRRRLNTMQYHLKSQTQPAETLIQCRTIKELPERTLKAVQTAIKQINKELNDKGRKRRKRLKENWKDKRSNNFAQKKYSPFLKSALGKHSSYKGIIGVHNPHTGGIDTTPDTVKEIATKRIAEKFYQATSPRPHFIRNPSPETWENLPPIIRDTFHPTHLPQKAADPKFNNVMRSTTMDETIASLRKMGKKKAAGPSGVTVEMLLHLPPDIQEEWLLPFLNKCLENRDIPPFLKKFYVWPLEKKVGEGSIIHPTDKMQLRPITLFEVVGKLTEHIINKRLMHILTRTKHLNRHQYAFRPESEAKDSILQTTLIHEDARHNKKELHSSNNDVSAAYDGIQPWVMKFIYQYHGFPPELIEFLINIDQGQEGQLLTAHGKGDPFDKKCGLGQGSILAPLKWSLFLDPMLNYITKIKKDAYTIKIKGKDHHYSISAFADDTQVFASTHAGYLIRFNHLTSYLATFNTVLSAEKTHYTYLSKHHKEAATTIHIPANTHDTDEQNIHSDTESSSEDTMSQQHRTLTNVTSPHEALRYLGAYLSLAGDWRGAKEHLMGIISKTVSAIHFKHLEWQEVKYIVTSTIQAQIQYYTLVTPMTKSELEKFDSQITQKFRRSIKLASTTNAHFLHMDAKRSFGYGLPSVLDTHDHTIINAAQATLTSSKPLGHLVRHSLRQYQEAIGWTSNPLDRNSCPHKPPKVNYWFSRVREAMDRQDINIPLADDNDKRTSNRMQDLPLHRVISSPTYNKLLPYLIKKGWKWVGDIADGTGTKLITQKLNTVAGRELQRALCNETGKLQFPVSPSDVAIKFGCFKPTHTQGAIVLHLRQDKRKIYNFYRIERSFEDENNRECVTATKLKKHTKHPANIFQDGKKHAVTETGSSPGYFYDAKSKDQIHEEFADAFVPITHRFVTLTNRNRPISTSILITTKQSIKTESFGEYKGTNTETTMQAHHEKFSQQFYIDDTDGLCYKKDEFDIRHTCEICTTSGHRGIDMTKCHNETCYRHAHTRCYQNTPWKCPECTPRQRKPDIVLALSETETNMIYEDIRTIYSASDGSVKGAMTNKASSTWGITIHTSTGRIHRRGKITIRQPEESSYRVEMEALRCAYKLIPANVEAIHAVDNLQTIKTHAWLCKFTHTKPTYDQCKKKQYVTTILKLWDAIHERGQILDIIHTKSHEENKETENQDLHNRRQALATADKAAGEAHNDKAYQETAMPYQLHHNNLPIEKKVSTSLKQIAQLNHYNTLKTYKREGSSLSLEYPNWPTGSDKWPTHLIRMRHLLLINRLPLNETRWIRQDKINQPISTAPDPPPGTVDELDSKSITLEEKERPLSPSSTTPNGEPQNRHHQKPTPPPQRISANCDICLNILGEEHIENLPHYLVDCCLANSRLMIFHTTLSKALSDQATIYSKQDNEEAMDIFRRLQEYDTEENTSVINKQSIKIKGRRMRVQWYNSAAIKIDLTDTKLKTHTTFAPPLLHLLHEKLNVQEHIGGISVNPHSKIPTYEISQLENRLKEEEPQTILIQNDTEPINTVTRITKRYPQHTVYIISPKTNSNQTNKNTITIQKTQIGLLPPAFWKGYHTGLKYAEQDWILTCPSGQKPELPQIIDYSDITVPPYIKNLIKSKDKTAIAFMSGGISMEVIKELKDYGIPEKYIRKIYKTLSKTLMEHQHEQWLERNTQVPHQKSIKSMNKKKLSTTRNNPPKRKPHEKPKPKKKSKRNQTPITQTDTESKAEPEDCINLSDDEKALPGPPPRELHIIPNQIHHMCQAMPEEAETELRQFLTLQGQEREQNAHNNEVVIQSGKEYIHRIDAAILTRPHIRGRATIEQARARYLHDNIIDAFLNQTAIRAYNGNHRVLCIGTYFKALHNDPKKTWEKLNKRKTKHIDMATIDTILIPINENNVHWTLGHIDLRKNWIVTYDSMGSGNNDDHIRGIIRLLQAHPLLKERQWHIVTMNNFPQQGNGYDCGLFACAAALCIMTKQIINFSQAHMENFRLQMAHVLIKDSTFLDHTTALNEEGKREQRGRQEAEANQTSSSTTTIPETNKPRTTQITDSSPIATKKQTRQRTLQETTTTTPNHPQSKKQTTIKDIVQQPKEQKRKWDKTKIESSTEPITVKQETGPKKKAKTTPKKSNKRKIESTQKAATAQTYITKPKPTPQAQQNKRPKTKRLSKTERFYKDREQNLKQSQIMDKFLNKIKPSPAPPLPPPSPPRSAAKKRTRAQERPTEPSSSQDKRTEPPRKKPDIKNPDAPT